MRYAALALLILLPACREEQAAIPDPAPMTEETLSYFCQMNVAEHPGPKGQVHLKGMPAPIFFAQVRDLVAYLKSPEREADITAIYVTDMGVAKSWSEPGATNWTPAKDAVFVVGAGVVGGMGAPEIVPFANTTDAGSFIERYGGNISSLEEIPTDAAIGPVDIDLDLELPS